MEEEERGVSGQPGSSRATRRNPLYHPSTRTTPLIQTTLPTPCFVLLLILFLLHILSKPLCPRPPSSPSLPAGGGSGHPSRKAYTHAPRTCVPVLCFHNHPRLVAGFPAFHPSVALFGGAVVSGDLSCTDRLFAASYSIHSTNDVLGRGRIKARS